MIKSMTGFGRCEIADEKRKFTVELKSVNHRYLDVNMKMPKKLNFFESAIRSLLKKYIERGKVDLYISYEDYTEDNYALKYNEGLAGEYLKYLNAMAETFHLENDVRVSTLSRYPDVFVMEEQEMDEEELSYKAVFDHTEGNVRVIVFQYYTLYMEAFIIHKEFDIRRS